jgi:DnaJ-class molecular chaperone
MADKQAPSNTAARPGDPLDLESSVAGEEDPGASIDLATPKGSEGRSDQPAGQADKQPSGGKAPMAPGDEAPVGTAGTGEDVCPQCGGSGRAGASSCPTCLGTGKVNVGVGGA